ncbi:hypothetical protein [Rhizobium leguminosarum]|uniref:hypothetical protein n=1 Tax=Rhizobium leguminosarum TaxID=384 RepID=UPI00140F57D3|nr:hypothetical protein [Rhizobium leguminosarum]QIO64727.1 hypothetical protein HA462_06575 [Rhizobium leguminosarum bv. trifolii]
MTNIASDEITLELNLARLNARLEELGDFPILRDKLEKARAEMIELLENLRFPIFKYDPTQQPVDDDGI